MRGGGVIDEEENLVREDQVDNPFKPRRRDGEYTDAGASQPGLCRKSNRVTWCLLFAFVIFAGMVAFNDGSKQTSNTNPPSTFDENLFEEKPPPKPPVGGRKRTASPTRINVEQERNKGKLDTKNEEFEDYQEDSEFEKHKDELEEAFMDEKDEVGSNQKAQTMDEDDEAILKKFKEEEQEEGDSTDEPDDYVEDQLGSHAEPEFTATKTKKPVSTKESKTPKVTPKTEEDARNSDGDSAESVVKTASPFNQAKNPKKKPVAPPTKKNSKKKSKATTTTTKPPEQQEEQGEDEKSPLVKDEDDISEKKDEDTGKAEETPSTTKELVDEEVQNSTKASPTHVDSVGQQQTNSTVNSTVGNHSTTSSPTIKLPSSEPKENSGKSVGITLTPTTSSTTPKPTRSSDRESEDDMENSDVDDGVADIDKSSDEEQPPAPPMESLDSDVANEDVEKSATQSPTT